PPTSTIADVACFERSVPERCAIILVRGRPSVPSPAGRGKGEGTTRAKPSPSSPPRGRGIKSLTRANYRVNLFSIANLSLLASLLQRYTFVVRHEERKDF